MIVLDGVEKKFGKKEVLKNISVKFEKGCYGLLGPNGAGKTTLLRCMLDLYTTNSGNISIEVKNKIGYLPQKFGVFRELSVYDMLYYFAALKKIPKKKRRDEIEQALLLVNLEDQGEEKIAHLSGGMQRRVGIAQAILGKPEILFFDEPTAGLDPEERIRFKSLITSLMKDRLILISTHIVEDVESVCDHVIIMNKGEIISDATVSETCNYAKDKVYEIAEDHSKVDELCYLEKTVERDGVLYRRVLSSEKPERGIPRIPTLEDGYMVKIRGIQ